MKTETKQQPLPTSPKGRSFLRSKAPSESGWCAGYSLPFGKGWGWASILCIMLLSPLFWRGVGGEASAQNTWTQKTDFGGVVRAYAVGFSIGSKGYIGTGGDATNRKDFWEYDPTANTWTQKTDFGGTARYGAVGFSIGSKGYIGTGFDGANKKDFWEYDPTANTWTQKTDFGGAARYMAVGFSIGSKGYIGTGNAGAYTKDFWEYDPTANSWTQKTDFGGTARERAVGFSIGSKGYIGTGFDVTATRKTDFWEYDPTANTWTQKTDLGGGRRVYAVGFSIGTKGYIGTGLDGVQYKDFWEYDQGANTWIQKTNFGGTARNRAVGFSIGCKGYIGTGYDGVYKKDFWEYTPSSCDALPIELLSFDATPVKDTNGKYYVRCEWSTATEINNDYFVIENSRDGKTFAQIGTVKGAGNSNTTLYYRFDDQLPYMDLSYYRLKQTDYDGKFSYSNIVAVYIGGMEIISIYPNPAEKEVKAKIAVMDNTEATVEVINVLGEQVVFRSASLKKGTTEISINTEKLAQGNYIFKATLPNKEHVQKMFVK